MESLLILLLMVWVMMWALYALFGVAGVDADSFIAALTHIGLVVLVAVLVLLALRLRKAFVEEQELEPGDHVFYLLQKFSSRPGPRAEKVRPMPRGEGFLYFVRKPWTVVEVHDDDTVEVVTNGGKHHVLRADDPHLHRAGLLESLAFRLRWGKHFPPPTA